MTRVSKNITYILSNAGQNEVESHLGSVNVLKYNNSTRTLFSGGRDGSVKLWGDKSTNAFENVIDNSDKDAIEPDFAGFKNSSNIETNNGFITAVSSKIIKNGLPFDSDENSNTYAFLNGAQLHTDWINDIQLTSNNSLLTASSDLLIKHWNYQTNTSTVVGNHTDYVQCLAVPNSTFRSFANCDSSSWVASGGLDKKVNVWDLNKNTKVSAYDTRDTGTFGNSGKLSFYNFSDKGSIYALSATDKLLASGGTENSISLIDTREKNIRLKLVGHTDTVRSLIMSDEWLLSGSADSTIKLWSLRNNRVYRTFDMHNSSVWSLYSSFPDFRIFYSGDKNGCLYKTDLRGCHLNDYAFTDEQDPASYLSPKLNENLGVFALLAKQNSGISSIAVEERDANIKTNDFTDTGKTVWACSRDFQVNSYANIKLHDLVLHQYLNVKNNLLNVIEPPEFLNGSDLKHVNSNNELYDLVSQLSIENPRTSLDNFSPKSNNRPKSITSLSMVDPADNLSDNMSFSSYEDAESLNSDSGSFETSFTNSNGTPSLQYLNQHLIEDGAGGNKYNFKVEVLTDPVRESLVSVIPIHKKSTSSIKSLSPMTKARILNDRRTVITMTDEGNVSVWNIITGKLLKTLENSGNQEDFFESVVEAYQTKETLQNWCAISIKIGRLFITMSENTFTNCEIYVDELAGVVDNEVIQLITNENTNPMDEIRINLGKIVLRSLFRNFIDYIVGEDQRFRQAIVDGKIKQTSTESSDNMPSAGKQLTSKPQQVTESSGGFKMFSRFGRKKKEKDDKEKHEESDKTGSRNGEVKKNQEVEQVATLPSNANNVILGQDSLLAVLENVKQNYMVMDKKQLMNSELKLPNNREIPLVSSLYQTPIRILINESASSLDGNFLNIFQFNSTDTDFQKDINNMKKYIPKWVGNALFKDEYVTKPVNKISFIVEEWKDGNTVTSLKKKKHVIIGPNADSVSGFGSSKTKLPPLVGSNTRLNAFQSIRVKKIMYFILEKFSHRTAEMKKMYPYANVKYENSIKVEDWLEILCNDEVLPPNMTILTVKTKIWKQSGDVVLKYRRKASQVPSK